MQPPSFDKGLWMDYVKAYTFIKKEYAVNLTNDELLRVITSNHRFMMEVKIAPKGTLVGEKYQCTPLQMKAIQNHNEWSYASDPDALPEHDRFICLDLEYDMRPSLTPSTWALSRAQTGHGQNTPSSPRRTPGPSPVPTICCNGGDAPNLHSS